MKKSTLIVAALAAFGALSLGKLTATNAFAQDAKSRAPKALALEQGESQEKHEENGEEEDDLLTAPYGVAQAVGVATQHFKGFVNKAELEKEKGKLVWSVSVVSPDGKKSAEVEIDGTTGAFSKLEVGDGEENDDAPTPMASAHEGKDGDSDGETNDGPEGATRG